MMEHRILSRPRSVLFALSSVSVLPALVACSHAPRPGSLPPQSLTSTPPGSLTQESEGKALSLEPLGEAPEPSPPRPAPGASSVHTTPAVQEEDPTLIVISGAEESQTEGVVETLRTIAAGRAGGQPEDPTLIVVSETEESQTGVVTPENLRRASRAERRRRTQAGEAAVVITDKNLAEFIKDTQLTYVETPDLPPADATESSNEPSTVQKGEGYWRQRGRELRQAWRDTVLEIEELEGQAAKLRRQFYAEDDPYVRDAQIKPDWDRALDRLLEAKERETTFPEQLDAFLNEGRRAGALPGWLREGQDLEPRQEAPEEFPELDPQEPKVLGENPPKP